MTTESEYQRKIEVALSKRQKKPEDRKGVFVWNKLIFKSAQGEYSICPSSADNTKICILSQGGEGGEFDAQAFYEVIDKFYKEHF